MSRMRLVILTMILSISLTKFDSSKYSTQFVPTVSMTDYVQD